MVRESLLLLLQLLLLIVIITILINLIIIILIVIFLIIKGTCESLGEKIHSVRCSNCLNSLGFKVINILTMMMMMIAIKMTNILTMMIVMVTSMMRMPTSMQTFCVRSWEVKRISTWGGTALRETWWLSSKLRCHCPWLWWSSSIVIFLIFLQIGRVVIFWWFNHNMIFLIFLQI